MTRPSEGPERPLTIGDVARAAGVNVQTLRYYERRGLLQEPERSSSGYRQYSFEAVRVIRFVKKAQDLGFTLEEVHDLLKMRSARGIDRDQVRLMAQQKIDGVNEKIRQLQSIRGALNALVDSCACATSDVHCPILEALEDEDSST